MAARRKDGLNHAGYVEMKKTEKVCSVLVTALCCGMLAYYIAAVFCLNLSVTPGFYTTDMYADIMVAVEMWEEKTLFPSSWIFGNQLYCFSTPVLAAVIYGITGNPFRSMGAAAFLMTLMVLASFDWMLRAAFPRRKDRVIGLVAMPALAALFGDAVLTMNGWQLLFTMCAYYACYAITAFLAFGCYLRSDRKVPKGMLVFTCVLSFAMGIQSLRQTAVMLFPLAAMEVLAIAGRASRKERLLTGTSWSATAVSITNLAGLVIGELIPVNQNQIFGAVTFASPGQYAGNLRESLGCAAALFFRDTTRVNPGYLIVLTVFVLAALACVRYHRKDGAVRLLALLVLSVLAIFGIDVVTTMQIRSIYYFILYPLLACLGIFLFSKGRAAVKTAVFTLLCVVFVLTAWFEVSPALVQVKDRTLDIHCQISRDLQELGFTTVYSRWNGCERIAAAGHGRIQAGFWSNPEDPFTPVPYLCNPAIYETAAEETAYVFYSLEEAEAGVRKAARSGVDLIPVTAYPEADIHIYTAPVNLLKYNFP